MLTSSRTTPSMHAIVADFVDGFRSVPLSDSATEYSWLMWAKKLFRLMSRAAHAA